MDVRRVLHSVEHLSTWIGKAFAWLIVVLMVVVVVEVFKRYAMNAPTAWIFDANNMLYGTLFMMGGAYALAHDGHVRGDFFYGRFRPRTQAALDLVLYVLFFLPGVVALTWAGWTFAGDALAIREQTFNATPLPLYPFKYVIPFAGAVVLLQGLSEMLRCVVCLQSGEWPERTKDFNEIDVVEQQLAGSTTLDEQARQEAIARTKSIDEQAKQRLNET